MQSLRVTLTMFINGDAELSTRINAILYEKCNPGGHPILVTFQVLRALLRDNPGQRHRIYTGRCSGKTQKKLRALVLGKGDTDEFATVYSVLRNGDVLVIDFGEHSDLSLVSGIGN